MYRASDKIIEFTPTGVVVVACLTLCFSVPLRAQIPVSQQKNSPTPAPPTASPKAAPAKPAPQVVTVLHRLNGLKMFRMLARSEQEMQAVAQVDEAFRLMEDVHTNVIAGLALEDGETIAVWLPDAELEFGPMAFAFGNFFQSFNTSAAGPKASTPRAVAVQNKKSFYYADPELTVIGPDGRQLAAQFVGLDGFTGLSILKLAQKTSSATKLAKASDIPVGTNLRVVGPELATQTRLISPKSLFVRMAETNGTVLGVSHSPSGDVSRFKLRSARLNLSSVGSVALNDAGEAVGIVSGIEGVDAMVLATTMIQSAAERVLTQQASVPRPFLGVRGEALVNTGIAQFEGLGWERERAANLVGDQRGILLTSIVPNSPASKAELKAGDVILKVNGEVIQNGEDFSWFLDQAGATKSVSFTVVGPKFVEARDVKVKLTGALDRSTFNQVRRPATSPRQFSLLSRGIESIALRPAVAARLGASAGLLVVYVAPATDAADAGLQAGDVIESIDGRSVIHPMTVHQFSNDPGKSHVLQVVRKKEKIVVKLENSGN